MAIRRLTVGDLVQACLDPAWREAWLRGRKPRLPTAGPPGAMLVFGLEFHKVAEDFVNLLVSREIDADPERLAGAGELWRLMWETIAGRLISALLDRGKPVESVHHLGEALKTFCGRLVELRNRTEGFVSWADVFLVREFALNNVHLALGRRKIALSGRMDAVRTHPEFGVEIVDYKLSHGARMQHDLLQLAVYAELLAAARPGLLFHGVLEYYEPDLHEVPVSSRELRTIFTETALPVLEELAGVEQSTRLPFGKSPAVSPGAISSGDLSQLVRDCFAAFNLEVEIVGRIEAPQLVRYQVRPAAGVKVVSLANRADDLQVALSLDRPPLIQPGKGSVAFDLPKERPDTVFWQAAVDNPEYRSQTSPVAFPIGVSVTNHLLTADLADPNTCHALVAGSSGSGKSEFLKQMAASLMQRGSPSLLRLSIVDPKRLTFSALTGSPFLNEPVISDMEAAMACLRRVVTDMEQRYARLADEGFESLSQRMADRRYDIPYYVLIFDEFTDLILGDKDRKKEFEELVARIAVKGRAAGIHLVLSTQRPDHKVVTGQIKANLPLKICLRVTSGRNSQIVLDQYGGETLLGRGDLLCERGKGLERAQSPYVRPQELKAAARV
jgi:S-DNA-T family DNA segregation ATPase FtsK/SpoIIIE